MMTVTYLSPLRVCRQTCSSTPIQLAGHAVARLALTPAPTTPPVGLQDPAGQHRPTRLEVLPDHLQTKVVEAAEHSQIRAAECSVRHVEVFLEERVGTLIFGRPRRLPPDRHAHPDYTLICEEPEVGVAGRVQR